MTVALVLSFGGEQNKPNKSGLNVNFCHLEDDEEGKEDEHKEQQAAGVHGQKVVFVWEIRLRRNRASHHQSVRFKLWI